MKLLTISVYVDEDKLDKTLESELATQNSYEFEKWIGSKTLDQKVKHQFHWLTGSGIQYNKIENDSINAKST